MNNDSKPSDEVDEVDEELEHVTKPSLNQEALNLLTAAELARMYQTHSLVEIQNSFLLGENVELVRRRAELFLGLVSDGVGKPVR
jgi:hypothetical protein